ncbi:DNA invertase Pin-like site-specific DNA recombinase [Bradyrhizobium sp. R2.2-H]|jgi:DNA invertase Pin-like site-specific DNA recombinase|uniref:recombinase family protein n=1 Tax=unclassified Bradyrhizobium TaxID=2631580 RepID=UPI0010449597|nr:MULTISPECIES: recombinase family protein [unclassified Bradyrhizobium]TCU75290.1 DNA invertase Pin-like site-specific DNA recombinase [Bradyrhizobium sp. Y-H1]TCU78058.1 DNA invertase Pin-like site-specific DNA recombinase [Bradyrhizobium sp. R2.2-H]
MSYHLAQSAKEPVRAAQYLRMSSENQRYSTENQENAIAEYALQHGYEIIASYVDAGKSGLSLRGRDALRELLSDALGSKRLFDTILVLDVSRWGRFQNPDQAAHYEFLCRQAGVSVVYCAEPFGEDVAPVTTIVKHLKRVMAGEYSRELSDKLARAKRQQAALGFRQGSRVLYGFRRVLVDAARNPKQNLRDGERKALSNDKVIVVPGPSEELEVIRRIFRMYVEDELSIASIARFFADQSIRGLANSYLTPAIIRRILSSELCIGRMTYNRTVHRLQNPVTKTPETAWTRFAAFEPIVPLALYNNAQERLAKQRRWDKEAIKVALQKLLAREGYLNQKLIENAKDAPSADTVAAHFGSLYAAYEAVGYCPPPVSPFGNNGKHWSKKAILTGLRKLHASHGYITNRLIDRCNYLPSDNYIRRHFGSIADALREVGLPVVAHSEVQKRSWNRRKTAGCDEYYHGVRWTDARLLRALRQLEQQFGYTSANLIDQNGSTPKSGYYVKRFGSLAKARKLAKLPSRSHSELTFAACKRRKEGTLIRRQWQESKRVSVLRYRSEDVLRGLRALARREGKITIALIDDEPSLPAATTVIHHFGSISRAYRLAGLVRLPGWPLRHGLPGTRYPRSSSGPKSNM